MTEPHADEVAVTRRTKSFIRTLAPGSTREGKCCGGTHVFCSYVTSVPFRARSGYKKTQAGKG